MSEDTGKPTIGRPTKYKPEYDEQAYKLSLLGLTDIELAQFFGVVESTIYCWKAEFPSFSEAINRGKDYADANVAEKLYQRACGYTHPEEHISNYQGQITITPTVKHYPPDTAAAFIWLKNRRSSKWRDKQEIEHSGTVTLEQLISESAKPKDNDD